MSAILLRHNRTGLFYRGFNRWVMYAEDAFDFQEPRRAVAWIQMVNLSGVDIVQKTEESSDPDFQEWSWPARGLAAAHR